MNRLMRLAPEPRAGAAPGDLAGPAQRQRQRGAISQAAWCRRRRSRWACRARSATTPTSTRASTTPPTIGKQFRPDNPLLPNYKWVPIGYHGRASSISRERARRSAVRMGQTQGAGRSAPGCRPSRAARLRARTRASSSAGPTRRASRSRSTTPRSTCSASLCSTTGRARDIQAWEYQPLGPFLSKNFASTVSPWIVTTRGAGAVSRAFTRPEGDPQPLPYLDSPSQPRARRDRHRARGLAADRDDARGRPCRRPHQPLELRATPTGRSRSWSRITR